MLLDSLNAGLEAIDVALESEQKQKLVDYATLLVRWNKAYNLSAINDPDQIVSQHLLDSLSILPYLPAGHVLDVGTGAGLPGIPLSIARPSQKFSLIDSRQKKINFVQHVITSLNLENVEAVCSRVESLHTYTDVAMVVSRAFASIRDYCMLIDKLITRDTVVLAMKGKIQLVRDELTELPANFVVSDLQTVTVPGTDERSLVFITKQGD